jgi:galactokinase
MPGTLQRVRAYAPGRVNLIGDHTDHTGGLALPMTIDRGTTVEGSRGGGAGVEGGRRVMLRSADEAQPAAIALPVIEPLIEPKLIEPPWARYVGGVVREMSMHSPDAPDSFRGGFEGRVHTTLPIGAGLSSSAALEVAVALALGFDGPALALAQLCRRAEQAASGVPCGLMDQLVIAAGRADHALLIDFTDLSTETVPIPDGAAIVVVDSGERRALASSAYGERSRACTAAAALIGPLREATESDLSGIDDAVLRRRARHVVTENARVGAFVDAFTTGDLAAAGAIMQASHASLRDDFEVSTPGLDALVARLATTPGVHGARLTGAGFGGCVVALAEPGALSEGWTVRASGPASVTTID